MIITWPTVIIKLDHHMTTTMIMIITWPTVIMFCMFVTTIYHHIILSYLQQLAVWNWFQNGPEVEMIKLYIQIVPISTPTAQVHILPEWVNFTPVFLVWCVVPRSNPGQQYPNPAPGVLATAPQGPMLPRATLAQLQNQNCYNCYCYYYNCTTVLHRALCCPVQLGLNYRIRTVTNKLWK